ncbi:MAG: DoxX family membrane protein [Pseudomonadota bacterium]
MFSHPLLDRSAAALDTASAAILGTLARLVFAGVLLIYFWNSALQKVGDGIFGFLNPGAGAYIAIWPRAMEAAGYDPSALGGFHYLVVVAGTLAEFILPLLILLGLLTRLAALGMIGFVIVQSATDLIGHGGWANGTFGAWFDRASDALIADQRAFWMLLLITLVLKGAGPLSLDRLIFERDV